MGHEATGEVVAVGDGVRELQPGDRVATNTIAACGHCRPCLAGERAICENRRILGMDAPGAYAEYVVWPEDSLPRLPDGLSYEAGALAEPLAVALHAVNMAGIKPGDAVLIAGAGPIGVLAHLLARIAGAGTIIVSDLHADRLRSARALGADIVVDASAADPVAVARELTGGSGVDVAIEAVGAGATARQTIDAVRNAGTVVWLGNSANLIEVEMQAVVTRNLTIRGSYAMTDGEFERALALLAAGRLPVDAVINRYASLDEGPALFEELLVSPATIKCVIRP
jgi:L-iditol 2-dehydrogenase